MKQLTIPMIRFTVLFVLGNLSAFGQDKTTADEKQYAPMPWHLVDVWWDIGKDVPFES